MRRMLPLSTMLFATSAAMIVSGCLSYESFLRKKNDKYCETLAKCSPDTLCTVAGPTDTGYGDFEACDFDAGAARDCLRGEWTCSDLIGSQEFSWPLSPDACAEVCRTGEEQTGEE